MAFRYLIYRTDFGNTIVRESVASSSTGGTEAELFTDFIIPEIQPLYLWRVTGGTTVVPNTDSNINSWLDNEYPISGDDPITYNIFTGYTAQTQTDLSGKINIVTGATGNVGEFDVSGNLIDSGFSIAQLTGGSGIDVYVSGVTYVGSTLTLKRTEGFPDLTVAIVTTGTTDGVVSGATLSGNTLVLSRTEGLPDVTADLSGLLTSVEADILTISGDVITNTTNITTISGDVTQNTTDIQLVSGVTTQNAADIIYLSGQTGGKQDVLTAGEGINATALAADIIRVDLSAFTAIGGLDITLTGSTSGVLNDLRTIATGLQYGGDYSANFTVRSLTDKGYVDAVASGLDLKESVFLATTTGSTNIDLTGGTFAGTIDGVVVPNGARVLIKNQNALKEDNGIYIYNSGTSGFTRSSDFVDPNVTSGAFAFVESGSTNGGSGWVLITQDPITIGTTELTFTQFSSTGSLTAGNGINITSGIVSVDGAVLAGNFIQWTGSLFNVTGLTTVADFNIYTGATDTRISNIEGDVITISGDVVQNTTDIATLSGSSISINAFTGYTATTEIRITNIEGDIVTISGDVITNSNDITYLSGVTDTKLDTSIFTGYTASTVSNELFLVHTGGTEINEITATAIPWNTGITVGSAYSFTGGSQIEILDAGEYEITYNIPFNQNGGNTGKGIGGNIILNNSDVINNTAAAGWTARDIAAGSVPLPTVNVTFAANDTIDLAMFRTGQAGSVLSSKNGTILIKKKNTLQ